MQVSKTTNIVIIIIGIVLSIVMVIPLIFRIQSELKWKETRRVMDLAEQEILQQIVITEEERLPVKKLEEFHAYIMSEKQEDQDKIILTFDALTMEFLDRINKQMNLSLKPEDLNMKLYGTKDNFIKYGDDTEVLYYNFILVNEEYHYSYFLNDTVNKSIMRGKKRIDRVSISNENNERIYSTYSEWKSKEAAYTGDIVSLTEYMNFVEQWEAGKIAYCDYVTLHNVIYHIHHED